MPEDNQKDILERQIGGVNLRVIWVIIFAVFAFASLYWSFKTDQILMEWRMKRVERVLKIENN